MYKKNVESIINNLNNRKYCDLSQHLKGFIKYMYYDVENDDLITCNRKSGSKIDFVVEINNISKNVSAKNSDIVIVYKDRIVNLILFLISINVSKECILALLYYHYADGTIDGSGEYIESFSGLLCDEYKNEIMTVNKEFENKELLAKVIDYVLINEKNGCKVDYFYFGDNRKGVYEKADIVQNNIVYANDKYQHKYMRIGVLNFHPLKRSVLFSDKINYQKHICILKLNLRRYIKK